MIFCGVTTNAAGERTEVNHLIKLTFGSPLTSGFFTFQSEALLAFAKVSSISVWKKAYRSYNNYTFIIFFTFAILWFLYFSINFINTAISDSLFRSFCS